MKKFFDRLRRWLIKKLGEYTEQFTPIQRQIEWTETEKPQKVQAQISVAMPSPDSAIDFRQYCEEQVLYILMRELYQSGFILWESQNDEIMQKVNVRATLRVVNANDLTPRFRWVE
ncbi:hypothetical protein D1159_00300 [Pseudoflavonifractor sp. 524-17]|uniref:hypothetical protein n=1 Tax=Pseudoflavonifractor sp. 524-17 TaxID=2304577 RepID=UPI00137A15F0|nr:hypothetical protein [Pseudoflavonifractor sp. 524-17]NCE63052.1 hypothetical protein [Pseudoflavonifractor sp. 524-17]